MNKVCGVGINYMKTYRRSDIHKKAYISWKGMLRRCYSTKALQHRKTYNGCSVCKEWHLFSNFYKWFIDKYRLGYSLDKDILVKGNKVYSPQTCCFVPLEINNIFADHNHHHSKYPLGVGYSKERGKYTAQLCKFGKPYALGRFDTLDEAIQARKEAESEYMLILAETYKDKIPSEVYNIIKDYKRYK